MQYSELALHLSQPHQPREVDHTYLCIDGKLYSGKFHVLDWYVRYDGIQTVETNTRKPVRVAAKGGQTFHKPALFV